MKVGKIRKVVGLFMLFAACSILWVGCKKEDPTIAKIVVIDEDGKRISGALVEMQSEEPAAGSEKTKRFDLSSTTDASGEVIFDLSDQTMPGQTGFAVLDITATASVNGVALEGKGIIKIVEHETSSEDIIVTD